MKQSRSRRPIALLATLAFFGAAGSASSQQPTPADIAGSWKIKSQLFDNDCTMTGKIIFRAATVKGAVPCDLLVETNCRSKAMREYWRVRETCSAKVMGDRIKITSKVTRVEDATYMGAPNSAEARAAYLADSFDMVLAKDLAQMNGHTFDGYRNLKMVFRREVEVTS